MSWDLVLSIVVSSILFLIFFMIGFVLIVAFIIWTSDLISNPEKVALQDLDLDEESSSLLKRKYRAYKVEGRFTYEKFDPKNIHDDDDRNALTHEDDWEFVEPKNLIVREPKRKPLTEEEKISRKEELEKFERYKARFEDEHSNFLAEIEKVKRRQKFPRSFKLIFIIIISFGILALSTSAFLISTSFFGIDLNFKTKRETQREVSIREQQISTQLNEVEISAGKLAKSNELTVQEISLEASKLKTRVASLQENLRQQIEESTKKREDLDVRAKEFDLKLEQFEHVQNMRQQEFDAVKSLLFEETINSSRRYWLLGLVSSIPLFWLSELIKFWFFKLLTKMRMRPRSNIEKRLSMGKGT